HYDGMKGFEGTAFRKNAEWMNSHGYSFDFISDKQIKNLSFDKTQRAIQSAGGRYQTLLLSAVDHMPEATLAKILELAKAGATILVYDHLPKIFNGLGDTAARRKVFNQLLQT